MRTARAFFPPGLSVFVTSNSPRMNPPSMCPSSAPFRYTSAFQLMPRKCRHAWLHFGGINWKADVYLNGALLGHIDGGFMRGEFDVTKTLKPGGKNALAVRIRKNATPGSVKEKTWESPDPNGGALGADNPTYHATAGWDWIPSVRGRDIGIWSDIYLDTSGPVTIENPFVSTTLPLPGMAFFRMRTARAFFPPGLSVFVISNSPRMN